jgi:glucosylceramidase
VSPPAPDGGGAVEKARAPHRGQGETASSAARQPASSVAAKGVAPDTGVARPPPAAFLTTDDLASALAPVPIAFGYAGGANPEAVVTIDPTTTYQSIVGFGGSITDSSSYVLTKYLSASALQEALANLFDPAVGIGLSFLRQPMGASDATSVGNYSYDDGAYDPDLTNFNLAQDLKATIPVLKRVVAISPDVYIIGTPWSPPAWMKQNGSMNGSSTTAAGLKADAYAPLGRYFTKFVQGYEAQGIHISAVTPQNEPRYFVGTYPQMDLPAPQERQFIAQDLGPSLESAGLSTLIWALDDSREVDSYPRTVLADPRASSLTEGVAFHCYGIDLSAMTTFHTAFPSKSVYMTECSGSFADRDPFASVIDLAIDSTANWARAVALWNLALDENAGPQNDGCRECRGIVTVNSRTGDVTYNADYYALGHFSRFVRPGATRIGSTSSSASLKQVAFLGVDGRLALVAHNIGRSSLTVRIGTGPDTMNVIVPANAAVTVTWSATGSDVAEGSQR